MELLKKQSITETFVDVLICVVPIWLAVTIGLTIGWSWRPRWTGLVLLGFRSKFRFIWTAPPGFGARRLWLAFTALSAFSVFRTILSNFMKRRFKESASDSSVPLQSPLPTAWISPESVADAVRWALFIFYFNFFIVYVIIWEPFFVVNILDESVFDAGCFISLIPYNLYRGKHELD